MKIDEVRQIVENEGIVFLTYGGFLSQSIISGMTEALEKEAEHNNLQMNISTNIFTVFIELAQNMMNYSKTHEEECNEVRSSGLILVGKSSEDHYYIQSQNIVSSIDKDKIEPKLMEIKTLDRDGIKKRYKELRRSGKDTHSKGGGIGFYEIAKRSNSIEYAFEKINENKFYFKFKSIIELK